jgi:hypothetical protein
MRGHMDHHHLILVVALVMVCVAFLLIFILVHAPQLVIPPAAPVPRSCIIAVVCPP